MMLDEDVVAVSPSSVYRVLKAAGRLDRKSIKPRKIGTGLATSSPPIVWPLGNNNFAAINNDVRPGQRIFRFDSSVSDQLAELPQQLRSSARLGLNFGAWSCPSFKINGVRATGFYGIWRSCSQISEHFRSISPKKMAFNP
jgi:hypothetical protein